MEMFRNMSKIEIYVFVIVFFFALPLSILPYTNDSTDIGCIWICLFLGFVALHVVRYGELPKGFPDIF